MFTWEIPVPFEAHERKAILLSYLDLDVPEEEKIVAFIDSPLYGYGSNRDSSAVAFDKLLSNKKLVAPIGDPERRRAKAAGVYIRYLGGIHYDATLYENRDVADYLAHPRARDFSVEKTSVLAGIVYGYPTYNIVEFLTRISLQDCINDQMEPRKVSFFDLFLHNFTERDFVIYTSPEEIQGLIQYLESKGATDFYSDNPYELHLILGNDLVGFCYQQAIESVASGLL